MAIQSGYQKTLVGIGAQWELTIVSPLPIDLPASINQARSRKIHRGIRQR